MGEVNKIAEPILTARCHQKGEVLLFPSFLITRFFSYLCKLCYLLQCSINEFSSSVCSKLIQQKKQIVSW